MNEHANSVIIAIFYSTSNTQTEKNAFYTFYYGLNNG